MRRRRKHRPKQVATANAGRFSYPALALVLALVLGGGGSPAPLPEMVLQVVFCVIVALWIRDLPNPLRQAVPRQAWMIALLVVILPLVQLLPLPPALWQALPGREVERDALALIGRAGEWRPLSMAPDRTFASLLALLPPLALLAMTAASDRRQRVTIIAAVAVACLLTVVLGALQLSGGPGSPFRPYPPNAGNLVGFQANRNSTVDLLLIGIVATAALLKERASKRNGLLLCAAAALILVIAAVLTASRTGILMVPIAIIAAVLALGDWLAITRRAVLGVALGSVVVVGVGSVALANNVTIANIIARFDSEQELRPELWRDSLYVAGQHFPVGAGVGNFVPAMIAGERLEIVRPALPNRAHNDYLELAVEGGIFALGLLMAVTAIVLAAARRSWRNPVDSTRSMLIFGSSALIILSLHSLVDYPFRSMALACLGAACAGLFLPRPRGRNPAGQPETTRDMA